MAKLNHENPKVENTKWTAIPVYHKFPFRDFVFRVFVILCGFTYSLRSNTTRPPTIVVSTRVLPISLTGHVM